MSATTLTDPLTSFLERLDAPRKAGNGWEAKCPGHEDRHASLSVKRGDDGKVLIHCHAGCSPEQICEAMGMKVSELFAPKSNGNGRMNGNGRRIVATYPYADETGKLLYQALRYDPKGFTQRRPDGNSGWTYKLDGVRRVLYRLPELLVAKLEQPEDWRFVVEGEKDVDRLRAAGLIATCNVGGAGKWKDKYSRALQGCRVAILPDNDPPGRAHAEQVARSLAPFASETRIVELPGLPEKGDASDYLAAGGTAESLLAIVEAAPVWERTETASTPAPECGLVLTRLADVEPQPVRWLWPQRFALGKVSLLCGDPGLGKSFVTIDMAAIVSVGGGWPDCGHERTARGSVILLNAEDDLADTIRPRLDAAGADVSRVVFLRGMRRPTANGKTTIQAFTLADVAMLREAIQATPDCRLIIIDPVSAYLADADSHRNAEIRGMLAPLAELAAESGAAVVLVTHLNKSGGGRALHRAMGSLAFVAAARSAWLITADKAESRRRLFLPMKNNLGNDSTGLAYSIIGEEQQARVVWEREPITLKADDALDGSEEQRRGPDPACKNAAVEWLTEILSAGPLESSKVKIEAAAAGLTWRTIRRAQETIGIKPFKAQFGGAWTWKLPPAGAG